jgi:hypothetical protein
MIKELIFILVLIVIILCAVVARPASILKVTKDSVTKDIGGDNVSTENTQSVENIDTPTAKNSQRRKSNKTSRVRFSPEKNLRTYNVKTGVIVGDTTVQIDEAESEN